jgi:PAS domain S-box-containing protein
VHQNLRFRLKVLMIRQIVEIKVQPLMEIEKSANIAEETYRILFDHSGTAFAVVSNTSSLRMINHQFVSLCGYQKADIERRKMLLDFFYDENREQIKSFLHKGRLKNDHIGHSLECLFYGADKIPKNVYVSISAIPRTRNFLVSITDVTELRQLQSRLARSEQLAAIGELSASIAHEIRNPLGAINTSVEVLRNSLKLSGEDGDLMQIIMEETQRLDRIIKDFLHFARMDCARLQPVVLNQIIRDTLFLFKGSLHNQIKVQTNLDEELPNIFGDADQLRQVVINMIVNSMEAMPQGGLLSVRSKMVNVEPGALFVQLLIQDSGQGIESNHLKKIFKPFFSTKAKGGGMGLAICERIVQNHGGGIEVTSEVGTGTTFIITLPVGGSALGKE